ncbi:MAG: hypothetical protein AAGA97_00340 [Pseudomonadota bacterium]
MTSASLATPARIGCKPWLVIDVQHGLSNRLRAIASAATIARHTDRALVVLWHPDHHCNCKISDLLDYPGAVIEDDPGGVIRDDLDIVYSYMEVDEGHCYEKPILTDPASAGKSVFIRSAYSLISPHSRPDEERHFLKSLTPAEPVRDLIAPIRRPNQVAAHIRMGTGAGFNHLSYEAPDNWPAYRHADMTEWRIKSHDRHFMARVETLIERGECDTLFLAADLKETYERFITRFGDRIAWLERDLFDRSTRQLQYALADMILLTAADRFLSSTSSSFSDLAKQLARPGRRTERSGIDF